jgi:hypothetical protein
MSNLILISEKIRDHLTKQRKQSKTAYGGSQTPSCAYRGDNGLMCAVGCLIVDEVYSESLESLCADTSQVVRAMSDSLGFDITEKMEQLCTDWQLYHDDEINGFSYRVWIESGDDNISPEMFHVHMMGVHG